MGRLCKGGGTTHRRYSSGTPIAPLCASNFLRPANSPRRLNATTKTPKLNGLPGQPPTRMGVGTPSDASHTLHLHIP